MYVYICIFVCVCVCVFFFATTVWGNKMNIYIKRYFISVLILDKNIVLKAQHTYGMLVMHVD